MFFVCFFLNVIMVFLSDTSVSFLKTGPKTVFLLLFTLLTEPPFQV